MKISELAREAGVAPSAVRWYEEVGIPASPAPGATTAIATTARMTSLVSAWCSACAGSASGRRMRAG